MGDGGEVPSRMVGVSAYVDLPSHHEVQKFPLAPADPGGPGKRAVKKVVVVIIPSTMIHSILRVQITCLAIFFAQPLRVLFGLPLGVKPSAIPVTL